ncbi:MAG: hypothetical protein ACI9NC_002298, partial [Verrucomicrobiales bacterium]
SVVGTKALGNKPLPLCMKMKRVGGLPAVGLANKPGANPIAPALRREFFRKFRRLCMGKMFLTN